MPWDSTDKYRDEDYNLRRGTRRSRWRGGPDRRARGGGRRVEASSEEVLYALPEPRGIAEQILYALPHWTLRPLSFLNALRQGELLFCASMIFRTEWTEAKANGYKTWPHCCTQGGCWKHTRRGNTAAYPCRCRCVWCRVANRVGR